MKCLCFGLTGLFFLGIFIFIGCNKKETPVLTISTGSITVDSGTGSFMIYVKSNSPWTVKSDQNWCTPAKTTGLNNENLKFDYKENPAMLKRNCIITFSLSGIPEATLSVSQGPSSIHSLLAERSWLLIADSINPKVKVDTAYSYNFYLLIEACVRDNLQKFLKTGVWVKNEGPTKCNDTDPQETNGAWNYNLSQNILTVNDPVYGLITYNLVYISTTRMMLKYQMQEDHGDGPKNYTHFQKFEVH